MRRKLGGRLDVRWLDFSRERTVVVEADGRVVLEGPREATDVLLDRILPPTLGTPRPLSWSTCSE